MLNSADYSAFHRLVQTWRYNFPTMSTVFEAMLQTIADESSAEADLDSMGGMPWTSVRGLRQDLDADRYHETLDRMNVVKVGRGIYAGMITLFLSRILGTFRADISATQDEWRSTGALLQGCSFGQIIEAAANNVRHADEWLVTSSASTQQLKSVRVITAVLQQPMPMDGSIRGFAHDVSPDILDLLSGRDFLQLERGTFAFAMALLSHREKRTASL
ncbi:hypothetical protein JQK15_22675 [Sphingobium sp. BHU LFT2]|nr:hypothetical protein [Sphingobium sp. BHU LFT2]